jgi:hypothetical protein
MWEARMSAESPADAGVRRAEVVAALSLATDLGVGQPMGHALRSCLLAVDLGASLGLGADDLRTVYYVALLQRVGCTADAFELSAWFDDEIAAHARTFTIDFGRPVEVMIDLVRQAGAGRPPLRRLSTQPGLKIAFSRCWLGGLWDKRHPIPEALQAMDEPPRYPLAIPLIEVVAAQVAIDCPLRQHVVDDDQDRVGDGDGCLRPAAPGCQPPVLRCQVGSLGAGRGVRRLDQTRPQPGTSLAGGAAPAFASALMIARTQPGPGGQILCGREAGEIDADLGDQRLGHGATDAGDGVQSRDCLLVGAHAFGNLPAHLGDARIEEVDVGELLGNQETLVRPEVSDQGLLQLGELLAQPTVRELRELGSIGLSGNQRGQHRAPRFAQDIRRH